MVPVPKSPIRHFQANSPFTKEQKSWVVTKFSELKSIALVKRSFRQQFCPRKPRRVPRPNAFHRLIERFERERATWPSVPSGRSSTADEEVEKVKVFFEENPAAHVRQASQQLKMVTGKVWRILRRNLRWRPCRPHLAPTLTSAHQASRLQACRFCLQHAEDYFERVLWSDEKWFVLTPAANRKNKVIWCPSNPHKIIPCKNAHGEKVMAWVGIVDGRCLPVHWFQ